MPETIVVTVDPARIQVKPGEEGVATITVRNRLEEVLYYGLRLEGGPPGWAEIIPDQGSAFPLQETRARVLVHPPPDTHGAIYTLAIRAASQERPDIEGRALLELEVFAPVQPPTRPPTVVPETRPSVGVTADQIRVTPEPVENPNLVPPACQWRLSLQNAGPVLDTFGFSIVGIPPAWVNLDPTQVTLHPDETGSALLTITPGDDTPAGTYAFKLITYSHLNINQRTERPLKVEVQPSTGFTLTVWPRDPESQGAKDFDVSLTSDRRSNTDLWLDLSASDPDNALDYTFEPRQVLLPARQAAKSTLRARPRAVLGPNERRIYKIKVVATPRGAIAPEQTDEVQLTQVASPPPTLDLRPKVQAGDLEAEYTIMAANPSTVETTLILSASDPEDGCIYVFDPPKLFLPAKGPAQGRLRVTAKVYSEGEGEKAFPFTVAGTREGDLVPVVRAEGRFVQRQVKPVTLELVPPQQSRSGRARYFVKASNPRPRPVQVWLDAMDDADALSYSFNPRQIQLSAGAEGGTRLTVTPKDKLLPGEQRRVHRFRVIGKVEGSAAPPTVTGTLAQVRGIDWGAIAKVLLWVLKWIVALAILVFLVTLALAGMDEITTRDPSGLGTLFRHVVGNDLVRLVLSLPFAGPARAVVRFLYQFVDLLTRARR